MRIGTRGSALALAQAGAVGALLGGGHEIVTITTAGDRGEAIGDKARWTSALEQALLDGRIDVAVHSAKDVPGELADGTTIAAVPLRQDPSDALCGAAEIASLGSGARVGTSSIRRTAQLRALREDLTVVELRGNVDTRLRKLEAGEVDALVLAKAGLDRLGRSAEATGLLHELVPAPGQGALLVQARDGDSATLAQVATINDSSAERCVISERALAGHLEATCNTPLGALAVPASELDVTLRAWVGLPDGSHWIADEITAPPEQAARELAERMTSVGARELLARAEAMAGDGKETHPDGGFPSRRSDRVQS
ncbi:MAG: hydroxymethylbilane synthase [Conexibacteraceae bacterium]|nr:hydroxymethylbilane synthase [Conexibacteraceae bacterium]